MTGNTTLRQLGFSDYEARAYMALVRGGLMNGYELAKAAGVPRANVYAVLERLVERGAARSADSASGQRYAATPPDLLIERLNRGYAAKLAAARDELEAMAAPADFGYVWNLRGYEALLEQARELIDGAQGSLLFGIQPSEAAPLAGAMEAAEARGVAVTTLCMQACVTECGGCHGDLHRCFVQPAAGHRALLVVADDARLLAAEISSDDQAFAIRTDERLIVELAAAYIRQSISMAALAGDLEGRFDELLSAATRATLSKLDPAGDFIGSLRRLAHGPDAAQ